MNRGSCEKKDMPFLLCGRSGYNSLAWGLKSSYNKENCFCISQEYCMMMTIDEFEETMDQIAE